MGYESRFYVVAISKASKDGYCMELSKFNLGKLGYESRTYDLVRKSSPCNYFIYADDGNTEIRKDRYNESLREVKKSDLINAIIEDLQDYKSNIKSSFVAYLKSIEKHWCGEIIVLHYGY